jgi:hypothetical protein
LMDLLYSHLVRSYNYSIRKDRLLLLFRKHIYRSTFSFWGKSSIFNVNVRLCFFMRKKCTHMVMEIETQNNFSTRGTCPRQWASL